MFFNEWKKTVKRPEVWIAFLLICLLQGFFTWRMIPENAREYEAGYEKYGGVMNEEWREKIRGLYGAFLEREGREWEELEAYTLDALILHDAWRFAHFDEMVESYIEWEIEYETQMDSDYDTDRIRAAYQTLLEQSDRLIFGNALPRSMMTRSLRVLCQCFLMFLTLFAAAFYTGERDTGMDAVLYTTKRGRRGLDVAKFAVCQSLSLLAALALVGVSAAVVFARAGWGGLDACVQEFANAENTCPFAWNNGTYLLVILFVALAACEVAAGAVFVLARTLRSTVRIIGTALGALLIPALLFEAYPGPLLGLWFSNFIQGEYLWNSFYEFRFGTVYIPYWQLALATLAVLFAALACYWIHMGRGRDDERVHSV